MALKVVLWVFGIFCNWAATAYQCIWHKLYWLMNQIRALTQDLIVELHGAQMLFRCGHRLWVTKFVVDLALLKVVFVP